MFHLFDKIFLFSIVLTFYNLIIAFDIYSSISSLWSSSFLLSITILYTFWIISASAHSKRLIIHIFNKQAFLRSIMLEFFKNSAKDFHHKLQYYHPIAIYRSNTDLKCGGFQGSCVGNEEPAMQKILQEQLSHGKVITQLSHIISESVHRTGKQGRSCPISFCPISTELWWWNLYLAYQTTTEWHLVSN